jgi:hypothetical protein
LKREFLLNMRKASLSEEKSSKYTLIIITLQKNALYDNLFPDKNKLLFLAIYYKFNLLNNLIKFPQVIPR